MKDAAVAADRLAFLTVTGSDPRRVRRPILASWQRSRAHHVAADRVAPPYDPGKVDGAPDTPLVRAAVPAIDDLRDAVADEPMSILLTDATGSVLTRVTDDRALERRLDKAMLAPGFQYAEAFVGTNGIGTALEMGGPAHVLGHEHYAENLEDLACAAVPLCHPVTGRTVGVVNLTTWRRSAGSLLLTLARTTASQVRAGLLDQTDPCARALFTEHQRTHHRFPGAVLAVGGEVSLLNDAARDSLADADRAVLLERVAEAAEDARDRDVPVALADGSAAVLHCRVVGGPTGCAGVVATLVRGGARRAETKEGSAGSPPAARSAATGAGGRHLTSWELLERDAIVAALGEAGGDKRAAAAALGMSRATVYRRIRAYRIA